MKKRKRQKSQIPLYLAIAGGLLLILTAVLLTTQKVPTTATPAHEEGFPEIQRVSLVDAKSALDADEAVIVDVRAVEAYQTAHIAGAINIPSNEIETRLGELDKNQWIITYCT